MSTTYLSFAPEEAQFYSGSFPGFVLTNGVNFPVAGLAYDASTNENAFWTFQATAYTSGVLNLDINWYADTALSGDVVWNTALAVITPNTDTGSVRAKGFAPDSTVTDTHLVTGPHMLHQCSITITGLDSLASNDAVWLRVTRDTTNGADTIAGDCILTNLRLSYIST